MTNICDIINVTPSISQLQLCCLSSHTQQMFLVVFTVDLWMDGEGAQVQSQEAGASSLALPQLPFLPFCFEQQQSWWSCRRHHGTMKRRPNLSE